MLPGPLLWVSDLAWSLLSLPHLGVLLLAAPACPWVRTASLPEWKHKDVCYKCDYVLFPAERPNSSSQLNWDTRESAHQNVLVPVSKQ